MELLRGFVDIQINGYDGVDFSADDLTVEGVQRATEKLVKSGTWAYAPTIITSDINLICHNAEIIVKALSEKPYATHFLGLHIEGPFISPEDGYRGAHRLEYVIPPSIDIFRKIQKAASGKVVMMTYAPETQGALEFAKQMQKESAKLSIGHTNADEKSFREAVNAGACLSTHLGNGIKNQLPRHPNNIQSILIEDRVMSGIITDGHHLGETFIRLCLKAKGVKNLYVTCDCAHLVGYPPGRYTTLGQDVIISETGRLSSATGDFLVGSASNTFMCMNYLAGLVKELTYEELLQLGIFNSLKGIGAKMPEGQGLVNHKLFFDETTRKFSLI